MSILKKVLSKETEVRTVPHSVQDILPIHKIYSDGIFLVGGTSFGKKHYSVTYKFSDINIESMDLEVQESLVKQYMALLNSFDEDTSTQITINNRKVDMCDIKRDILIEGNPDDLLDRYRKDVNDIYLKKIQEANAITQDKYITVSVFCSSIDEARKYFHQKYIELVSLFGSLGSKVEQLNAEERLKIYHNFFNGERGSEFLFDFKNALRQGHDFKDYVCPSSMEIKGNYIKFGDKYCSTLFLLNYASSIRIDFMNEMTLNSKNMMITTNSIAVPKALAANVLQRKFDGVQTEIQTFTKNQVKNGNYNAQIPYDMEKQRDELTEWLNDLKGRDQRMFFTLVTIVHVADSVEELERDRASLISTASSQFMCTFDFVPFAQLDLMNSTLPSGVRRFDVMRSLTTETLAAFIPFRTQEIMHKGGNYFGMNASSKGEVSMATLDGIQDYHDDNNNMNNMIFINRHNRDYLANGNALFLGTSGSGKSFGIKWDIIQTLLRDPTADVLIIDPEREYSAVTKAFGGEVIEISAQSDTHINAMDLNAQYAEKGSPVTAKVDFILSLCEICMSSSGGVGLKGSYKSIIDRCAEIVYKDLIDSKFTIPSPTLLDFYNVLLEQPEEEAKEIALELEVFTKGSLNTFAQPSNVDVNNRLVCYDIKDLSSNLMAVGMLVILDSILNRITRNRQEGRKTCVYIDELYLLFLHEYSTEFLFKLWKRIRKYNGFMTGITQNVGDMLENTRCSDMFSNSGVIVVYNQQGSDVELLSQMLDISDEQKKFITNVGRGEGLLKCGNTKIRFTSTLPKDTVLYRLMTSNPNEVLSDEELNELIKDNEFNDSL